MTNTKRVIDLSSMHPHTVFRTKLRFAVSVYSMSRSAIWGKIQIKGGSIGPTEGSAIINLLYNLTCYNY